ncbi:MAG: hypothetical protein PUC05_08475, partial [Firmicutes bacterium]|nr:hypothetical protein [Bacillota bacterium]
KDMMPGENAAPIHPNCRCSVAAWENDAEYEAWLDYLDKGGTTAEWNTTGKAERESKKQHLTDVYRRNKIESQNIDNRRMANSARQSPLHILTENEICSVKADAESLQIPLEILRFNEGDNTGFIDSRKIINIRGDVLPDPSSQQLRDRLSQKAVLAHEYYGHYKNHPSTFRIGEWRDEFRASYCAAINAPSLSDEERRMLMLDAYDRAKESGVRVSYNKKARELIYGNDE